MYEEQFKNEEFCRSELLEARRIFGTKPFTQAKADNLLKGLCLMLAHCPDSMVDMVTGHIKELQIRMSYIPLLEGKSNV